MSTVTRNGTPLDVALPAGSPAGGIVVVQEAFGVTDHIRDVNRRATAAGYVAVAPHLFWRHGDPELAYEGDMERVMATMATLTAEEIAADVDAALEELDERGLGAARVGVVGFCMGGSVTLATAVRRRLGAAVTFYGGGVTKARFGYPPLIELAPELRTPWLGLFGDLDQGIPVEEVEALRVAASRSEVATEVVRYEDAGHGFHCDARASYHAVSARDAWQRTLAWFQTHLAAAAG